MSTPPPIPPPARSAPVYTAGVPAVCRPVSLLWAGLLAFFLAAAPLGAEPLVLRVGVYPNNPLTFVDKDGSVKGLFIDVLKEIAADRGWRLTFVPDSWNRSLDGLARGEIDLLGAIAFSTQRAQQFDFTAESVLTNWGQVYIHPDRRIESVLELKNLKVAVLHNDIYYRGLRDLLQRFGVPCRFVEAYDYEDVLQLVARGRCDAGLVNQLYGLKNAQRFNIVRSPIVLSPRNLYWAAPRGRQREVLNAIDSRMRRMKKNPQSTYHRSTARWLGAEHRFPYVRWLRWAGGSLLALLGLLSAVVLAFRAQVKARTSEVIAKNEALKAEIAQRRMAERERSALASRLQRAQKMEAIGTLAGGVAHDLNNILSGLVSYPDLLLLQIPPDSPLHQPVQTIKSSGEKAAAMVQDLLTLARRGVAVSESVDLNGVITDYLFSPEHRRLAAIHPRMALRDRLEKRLWPMEGSPVHLSKTVMNLVSNAFEASPPDGEVVIATGNRSLERTAGDYEEIPAGEYVMLSVSDRGAGIARKDLDKIFEPFYTKKVMGHSGTGLGMTVVWGTVKDHAGFIDVHSAPESGTIFELYFPVCRTAERAVPEEGRTEDGLRGNGETVLVVDDAELQRRIASEMLRELGYRVSTAASGREALDMLEEKTVDLLLLDMIMPPGMDGLETYRRVLERHPGQRAVIASGYSETDRVRAAIRLGASGYLKKPYSLDNLGKALREGLRTREA